jgi:hypothetical protein
VTNDKARTPVLGRVGAWSMRPGGANEAKRALLSEDGFNGLADLGLGTELH